MLKQLWSPYLASGFAGFLGASTTFSRNAAVIEQAVGIDTATIEYFTMGKGKYGLSSLLNWQFMFVIGIIVVAFILGKHKL